MKTTSKTRTKLGEIYTPDFIVKKVLNHTGYRGKNILKKHIIDNSCGDGAFLTEIVRRYIKQSKKIKYSNTQILQDLETYIHGIEINQDSVRKCINNLNKITQNYINQTINWDIICGDTLNVTKFDNKMDFVVGNPPYVRIHDLTKQNINYNNFKISSNGMTDLYLIFFELGLNMLNLTGKLGYITPNSYFTSKSGEKLRKYFVENNTINKIINFGHFNPFKEITTYPVITILSTIKSPKVAYLEVDKEFKDVKVSNIKYDKFFIKDSFYFGKCNVLKNFQNIKQINIDVKVKNGVATNADNVFFNNEYSGDFINAAVKISTMNPTKVFYPYNKSGKLISLEEIKEKNSKMYQVLITNEEKLKSRSLQNQQWYEFARTQGILDVYKPKLLVNNLVKDVNSLKTKIVDSGVVPYSGFYVISDDYNLKIIKKIIKSEEFIDYVKILGKPKNGGYYTFSSKDLEIFISHKLGNQNEL